MISKIATASRAMHAFSVIEGGRGGGATGFCSVAKQAVEFPYNIQLEHLVKCCTSP